MFSRTVSEAMIFTVAIVLSIAAAASSAGAIDSCVLQKNTTVDLYKLSTLNHFFGEVLTTESNGNIYVVSICRPIPQIFYDPRKLAGAVKLTGQGYTVDLGHIDQSNVVVNENSIVLTYVGGDRDRNVEDTCKGLRWTTYLTFLCDPLANHDILTLIDEDPDQPEICQVWFEIRTTKMCKRQSITPLLLLEKEFFNHRNKADTKNNRETKEATKSNEINLKKFEYDTETINNNNKSSNIANQKNFIINDLEKKFNESFGNENYSAVKENNSTNDQWYENKKRSDIEKQDKYLNDYKKSLNDKNKNVINENNPPQGEANRSNSEKNTSEDKNSAENESTILWTNKNSSHYENIEYNPKKDLENKLINHKMNNTEPDISSYKEYSYPEKNITILHYNYLIKYLNRSKNSEGKYANSVLYEPIKRNANQEGKFNQNGPEDVSKNDIKYKKPIDIENHTESTPIQNTVENKSSNKKLNDFDANKKPSGNENNLNRNYSTDSSLKKDHQITPSSNNEEKNKTVNERTVKVNTSNQSQSKDDKSIVDDTKSPSDVAIKNNTNQTHLQNNNPESKSFQNAEKKNEIEKNLRNVNGSITESTPRDNSENKSTSGGDKSVDNDNIDTITKHNASDDNSIIEQNVKNNLYSTTSSDDNTIAVTINPTEKSRSNTKANDFTTRSGEVNGSITESTPRDNTENKPTGGGDKSVDNDYVDTTTKHYASDDNSTIEQNVKYNLYSTSSSDDNTIAVTIKPTANNPSNTVVNDVTTQSGEVNGLSTEQSVETSSINIKTNDKSQPNGTISNQIDNVKKSIQPDQSKSEPSGDSSDDDKTGDSNTTTDSTDQSGFSFDKLFSKFFPKGVHVSLATIIGSLASLAAVTGVVGTVINRYYYKLSGTDQIPFKGTFQSIFNLIKVVISTIFCGLCCGGGDFSPDITDSTNEKTPLLQPKFNVPTPVVVDETTQKSKKRNKSNDDGKQQKRNGTDSDNSGKQNSNNEYGSISNESKLNESLVKNAKEKLSKIESESQGKSIKEVIGGAIKNILTEKLKPTIDSISEKVGKKVEMTEDMKKNLETISNNAALISKFVENEKSTKNVEVKSKNTDPLLKNDKKPILNVEKNKETIVQNINEISKNVDLIKAPNSSEKAQSNKIEKHNAEVQEVINSKTVGKSQQSQNVKSTNEVVASKDAKSKMNESKSKFLELEKENENSQKVVSSGSTDKKVEDNDDESVEVIEEIIYVEGGEGEEDEEIIEEIIETTTIENSPDTLDEFNFNDSQPGSPGHSKVTVRTTRKISSSSEPGKVTTVEETVVTDGSPENEKKKSGFQFDVGKSGVSMSVGDKQLKIGKSGLKLKRSKSNSPNNVEGDEPDQRDTKSLEKSKKTKSIPNLKIFKRSVSQPTDDDIQEAEGESPQSDFAPVKKLSRTGSGLLKFGKSRSKSSLVLETAGDVTVDTDTMTNFIDQERRASSAGMDDGDVAAATVVRKISTTTTTLDGKVISESTETVEVPPGDLKIGSVKDRQSTKNADSKSNVKTKREKKDKTKVTRPF